MRLVFPTIAHKQAALDYRQEHFDDGVTAIDGDGGLDDANTYEDWLVRINDDLTRDDGRLVPATVYFAVVDGEIVGMLQIRHKLNAHLMQNGGHIGYGVRPSRRRRGYATKMLALALDKAHELGIDKALITCDKANTASAKTILSNGGVLENEVAEENGNIVQRYWISL